MRQTSIDTANVNDVMQAICIATADDSLKKEGRFLLLEWENENAYYTAQGLLLNTPGDRRDDAFWNKYYSYCRNVHATPNLGITAGIHQLLKAAVGLSPSVYYGGPASSVSNQGFLGISNGSTTVTAADSDLSGTTKAYKGIDTSFPTESLVSSKATLTWQATYGTSEAQFAWTCGGIFATSGTVPNAGSGSSGVTSIPASSTPLAIALWSPSPLTKGSSIISQQYQVSVA